MNDHQKRVLLVEDHQPTRDALRRILLRGGWEVLEAATVAEALGQLDPPPECVILDLMLPDGGGETILRQVRIEGVPIRVVLNTGLNDPARLSEVSYLQPDAVLRKPIDPEGIRTLCRTAAAESTQSRHRDRP